MRQLRVCLDTPDLVGDNLPDLVLDAVVVGVDLLLHGVVAVLVGEVDDLRYLHVAGGLPPDLLVIHYNLGMENLLLDALVEIVGYRTDEHTLCEVGNLACRNEAVHLGVDGDGGLVPVDGHVLPFLQDLAETLGERLGGFGNYLTCKDIADRIANHSGLFVPVITLQLAEILKAEHDGNLVASGGGNEVIQPTHVNGGQLVDNHGGFEPFFLVDELHDTGVVQSQRRPVNALPVGIVADYQHFRFFGIVDVEGEIVRRHHPVERRGNHAGKRYLGTGNLPLQLLHRRGFPCVHEGRKVILQLRVRGEDGENVGVLAVQELDGMGKGAILAVLVDFEIPYNTG